MFFEHIVCQFETFRLAQNFKNVCHIDMTQTGMWNIANMGRKLLKIDVFM